MDTPVLVEKRDGYRILTLNRPDRLNAFNDAMHKALKAAIEDADRDEGCRVLVLTGAGRGFCAGQDLADRQVMMTTGETPDLSRTLEASYNPLVRRIRRLRMPVVCAVNGTAAGAGANVALACDIVIAARSAKFLQAFARIGLIPDAGGTWLLPRLVGDARARALALLAEPVGAEQAEAWGMIWRAVDDASLMSEAEATAGRLAAMPAFALARIKEALEAASANSLDRQLDVERDLQGACGRSGEYREGIAAFFEKRAPRFNGRA